LLAAATIRRATKATATTPDPSILQEGLLLLRQMRRNRFERQFRNLYGQSWWNEKKRQEEIRVELEAELHHAEALLPGGVPIKT